MKLLHLLFFAGLVTTASFGQDAAQRVGYFRKVVACPGIDLVLKAGTEETVRFEYSNIDRAKIKMDLRGEKLHIYLEDARLYEKQKWVDDSGYGRKVDMYEDAVVIAYVTYKDLSGIEVRGDQRVSCESPIDSERFLLKVYGDNEVRLASLETRWLRVRMYGDNTLRIKTGHAGHQKYSLYGDNSIETRGLESFTASTTIYGDGKLSLNTSEELRLNSFGEPDIIVTGSPLISKGIVIGGASIVKR